MAAKLRRGFRKEAEEYAAEFRTELGLTNVAPLSAIQLATHLEIPVTELSKVNGISSEVVRYYHGAGADEFSATSLCDGTYREIIHNDSHHPNRQNSSIMHEVSHILLGHPPKPPLMENSCRHFDPTAEFEANQLAFTLLVPKPAALFAYERFATTSEAAVFFGVSNAVMVHRIRITDVVRWAQNRNGRSA